MDVALINPRVTGLDGHSFSSTLEASLDMPPLGLLYIATMLKENGFSVKVYDLNTIKDSKERQTVIHNIIKEKPKVVGISTMTPSFPDAVEIAKEIRRNAENQLTIVFGGYHVSFLPDESLRKEWADYVVRGEGEYVILNLVRGLLVKHSDVKVEGLAGVSYMREGKIIHNPPTVVRINDLESIPIPDRSLLDMKLYNAPGTIMGSRGCVGRCIFCSAVSWGRFKDRSVNSIIQELRYLNRQFNFKHICFIDNTFTVNREKTMALLSAISNDNIDCTFSLETRVSNIDSEILKKCKEGKVTAIQFGVESGDRKVLKEINKDITLEQVEKIVEISLRLGLRVMCSFIIGHPTDTEESIANTVQFVKRLRRMGAQTKFEILTPYPGTEIFNNRQKHGITILNWDFTKWGLAEPVYETKYLTNKKIGKLFRNAVMEVNII